MCSHVADRQRKVSAPEKWRKYTRDYSRKSSSKAARRKQKYGLTQYEFEQLWEANCGACHACGSVTRVCIDHDHTTGRVRGLLCDNCNKALGLLDDARDRVLRLCNYLEPKD